MLKRLTNSRNTQTITPGLGFKITGSYILESYDENLERWLDSLGISGPDLGPVFRSTKVKVLVKEPSKYNKKWNLTHREEGELASYLQSGNF